MLEKRLERKVGPDVVSQQSAITSKVTVSDSEPIVRLLDQKMPETTRSYSEAVMASTVEECHREIDRLRRSNQVRMQICSSRHF
jgi:hypothetical protein